MGMSKQQPIVIGILMTIVLVGFQNCSKVGVEEVGSSPDSAIADAANVPPADGGAALPGDPGSGDIVKAPPASDVPPTGQPPVASNPPSDANPPDVSHNPPDVSHNPPDQVCNQENHDHDQDQEGHHQANHNDQDQDNQGEHHPGDHGDHDGKPPVAKGPLCLPKSQMHAKQSDKKDLKTVGCIGDQTKSCLLVCHIPAGDPAKAHTLSVGSLSSVQAHLGHGDTLGECPEKKGKDSSDDLVCEDDGESDSKS